MGNNLPKHSATFHVWKALNDIFESCNVKISNSSALSHWMDMFEIMLDYQFKNSTWPITSANIVLVCKVGRGFHHCSADKIIEGDIYAIKVLDKEKNSEILLYTCSNPSPSLVG